MPIVQNWAPSKALLASSQASDTSSIDQRVDIWPSPAVKTQNWE
ncbi:MAG: hypothetical protein ABI180_07040 [Microcoleus sp.]